MLRIVSFLTRYALISQKEYLKVATEKLHQLAENAEKYEQDDVEISATDAILSIKKGGHTIVINTQTPNRQLWYSSTISGPQRYNLVQSKWLNGKDKEIGQVMEEDIRKMAAL